jgi:hypothetical protein
VVIRSHEILKSACANDPTRNNSTATILPFVTWPSHQRVWDLVGKHSAGISALLRLSPRCGPTTALDPASPHGPASVQLLPQNHVPRRVYAVHSLSGLLDKITEARRAKKLKTFWRARDERSRHLPQVRGSEVARRRLGW